MNTPETAASFCFVEETPLEVKDRSTLEHWATCPAQAAFIEAGLVNDSSHIANTGEAVHVAFGAGLRSYIELASDGEIMRPSQLADIVLTELRSSRPDVQPDALAAARRAVWLFSHTICDLHPMNILRWDGGEGERSGQLAYDIDGVCRVTSELDLLVATESPKVLREIDYKSGWKRWNHTEVARSFQFQTHAALVMENYPDVELLEVQVFDVRRSTLLYPVEFRRRDLPEWKARIANAAGEWWINRNTQPQDAPVWPAVEKCSICPAAALCRAAKHLGAIADDPPRYVKTMCALSAALDGMRFLADQWVDRHGDIIADGVCYGIDRPKKQQKPKKDLYVLTTQTQENEGEPTQ